MKIKNNQIKLEKIGGTSYIRKLYSVKYKIDYWENNSGETIVKEEIKYSTTCRTSFFYKQ